MFRFFVTKKDGAYFLLDATIRHHIKVVRIENKRFICVYKTKFYVCQLEHKKAKIIKQLDANHEYEGKVVLAMALIDRKRFEWLLAKATELGVHTIIPVISQNIAQKVAIFKNKLLRFQTILKNAAEQSFRNHIPTLLAPQLFTNVLTYKSTHKFIAHEQAKRLQVMSFPTNALFLVGPEGGFSNDEITMATKQGFQVVGLGKTILRSETAALTLLARLNE